MGRSADRETSPEETTISGGQRARLCARRDVLYEEINGELVLLNLETGKYYSFNPVASRMWHAVTTMPLKEAVAVLQEEFQVSTDQLLTDLLGFCDQLIAHGLVEAREVGDSPDAVQPGTTA